MSFFRRIHRPFIHELVLRVAECPELKILCLSSRRR